MKKNIIVFFTYLLLTLILTYPAALKINKEFIGPVEDNLFLSWQILSSARAFTSSEEVFYTNQIFYPAGVRFIYCPLLSHFLGFFLLKFFSLITTYNILILSTFVLGGFFLYLLANHLIKHPQASFIAGLIFTFSAYHFARAEHHLHLAVIYPLPLYILSLEKFYQKPSLKSILFFAFSLLCNYYNSIYYCFYLFYFSLLFFLFKFFENRTTFFNRIKFFPLVGVLFILGILPYIGAYIDASQSIHLYYSGHYTFVADLCGFLLPPMDHPFFRTNHIYPVLGNSWESAVFLGYLPLFLALWGVIETSDKKKWFYLTITLFFLILSLGPRLNIDKKEYFPSVHLPYYWLFMKIPFFKNARCPVRCVVMGILGISILAGWGSKVLLSKFRKKGEIFLLCLFSGIIVFETLKVPIVTSRPLPPAFYYQIRKEKNDYAILDVPRYGYIEGEIWMYFQTIHLKKICGGCTPRTTDYLYFFLQSLDKIENLRDYLKRNKIKYIVVHKNYLWEREKVFIKKIASQIPLFKKEPTADIYRVY
jgi:hypothetical protein